MNARKKLRELVERPGYTVVPGAYDPLIARLVQVAGFEAVYITGGGVSRSQGYPDLGLLTLTENVQVLCRIVDAVDIPVIADIDTGYGNAINVVRAVREYERAGVAGFHIEDQVAPKKCGHYEGKAVVGVQEMVGKIKAAVDTRRDADMVIIARSDARAIEGLDATIERVNAYLEAGADVGFVEAPQNIDELAAVPPRLRGPALVNIFEGGKTPALPAKQLEAMGFRLGIYPSQTHRAAIRAAQDVLAVLKRDGDTAAIEGRLATFNDREVAVNTALWREREAKYLGTGG
ncbi:MAG: oxaloacetate decarboxylase [Burkholderiales bacterium]|nr:oxaloacetate decarboxylase [Burkholderiales bacterium]